MGEIAEGMLEGFFCEWCGVVIDGDEPGYPRKCKACTKEDKALDSYLDTAQHIDTYSPKGGKK